MKKCNDCNVDMVEDVKVHTKLISVHFDDDLYIGLNGKTKKVKARICPKCGKVELYIEIEKDESLK